MTKPTEFKLKLTGGGLNVNQSVPPEVAQAIVALALGVKAPAAPPAPGGGAGEGGSGGLGQKSVRELMNELQAKRAPDQIATIGLHLKSTRGFTKFTKEQIIEGYEDAGEPLPKNLPRDIKWTTRIGWIAPKSGEANTFYLTNTGEEAATKHFPSDLRKRTKHPKARKGRALKSKTTKP